MNPSSTTSQFERAQADTQTLFQMMDARLQQERLEQSQPGHQESHNEQRRLEEQRAMHERLAEEQRRMCAELEQAQLAMRQEVERLRWRQEELELARQEHAAAVAAAAAAAVSANQQVSSITLQERRAQAAAGDAQRALEEALMNAQRSRRMEAENRERNEGEPPCPT